jgi:hypothetical protein
MDPRSVGFQTAEGFIDAVAVRLTPMPGAGTTKDENEVVAIKDESR